MALSVIFLGLNICDAPGSPLRHAAMLRNLLETGLVPCRRSELLPRSRSLLHWKTFFLAAKSGFVPGLYLLLRIIKRILAT